jgi:hypothetical protein
MSSYVGAGGGTIPSKEKSNQPQGRAGGAINKRRGPVTNAPGNSTKGGGINRSLSPTKQK